MKVAADLEIALSRVDEDGFEVKYCFSLPGEDQDERPPPFPVQIDFVELQKLALDVDADGRLLTTSVFGDSNARSKFLAFRSTARGKHLPLRLRLSIDPRASELHQLRWETLRDPEDDSLLLAGQDVFFSRYLSSVDGRQVGPRPKRPFRVLIAVANPTNLDGDYGLAPIRVADEIARIKEALKSEVQVDCLGDRDRLTLDNLSQRLRTGYDVLYLVCHGRLTGKDNDRPVLYLEAPDGKVSAVPGVELAKQLRALEEPPRLVVLASCESAGSGSGTTSSRIGDALASVGPRLAGAGIPAVLAMQGQITTTTVSRFMAAFFQEVLSDGQIDRAVAEARFRVSDRHDWWMPVLFLRLKSGSIWYVPGFADDRSSTNVWPGLKSAIEDGMCTPILGPGLLESFFGSTADIALGWAEELNFPMEVGSRDDFAQVAQYLVVTQGPAFARTELAKSLRRKLYAGFSGDLPPESRRPPPLDNLLQTAAKAHWKRDPLDPHRVLAKLGLSIYLTTNSDSLLEAALIAEGKQPQTMICPWYGEGKQSDVEFDRDADSDHPLVYHLFGHVSQLDSIVLTADDYFDYLIGVTRNNDLIPSAVRSLLSESALLFLGFRIDDWNFRVLLRSILNRQGNSQLGAYKHVAVQINLEEGSFLEPERARRYLEDYFAKAVRNDVEIRIFWGRVQDFTRVLATGGLMIKPDD